MSKKIIFQKATRIEGNANIQIEIADGHVQTARFLVHEFRGFEGFKRDPGRKHPSFGIQDLRLVLLFTSGGLDRSY